MCLSVLQLVNHCVSDGADNYAVVRQSPSYVIHPGRSTPQNVIPISTNINQHPPIPRTSFFLCSQSPYASATMVREMGEKRGIFGPCRMWLCRREATSTALVCWQCWWSLFVVLFVETLPCTCVSCSLYRAFRIQHWDVHRRSSRKSRTEEVDKDKEGELNQASKINPAPKSKQISPVAWLGIHAE